MIDAGQGLALIIDKELKEIFPPYVRYWELGWLKELHEKENHLRRTILLVIHGVSILVSALLYLLFSSHAEVRYELLLIYICIYAVLFIITYFNRRIEIVENIYLIFLIATFILNLFFPIFDNYFIVPLLVIPPAAYFFRDIRQATIISLAILVIFCFFYGISSSITSPWIRETPGILMFTTLLSSYIFESSLLFVRTYLSHRERISLFKSRIYEETTGLPKRYLIEHSVKQSSSIHISIISIKNLSHIGIIMGYDFLTKVTVTIANILKQHRDRYGFKLFRLTKGEFGIVLEGRDKGELKKQGESITDRLSREVKDLKITNNSIFIYVEIDFGSGIGSSDRISEILSKADQIKIDSHNFLGRRPYFSTDIRTRYITDQKLYDVLLSNIVNKTLEVHYQPIIDLASDKMMCYESLLRLRNSDNLLVSIYEYLDIAKRTGVYTQLTLFVMNTVFDAIRSTTQLRFSLNISLTDIENATIREFLFEHRDFLETNNDRLILEITETEIATNSEEMTAFLRFAHKHGIKIAIDDFGTGYSNFTRLSDFPPYLCKIDGKLFQKAFRDHLSSKVVAGIITLCKNLSVHTVAEFIETEEQRLFARELNVDFGQGYLFKKPGPHLDN